MFTGSWAFPSGSDGKEFVCDTGDPGLIPGSERSPGEGNDNHSSILAWKIPWTELPGGLQSMGLQRVRHDWVTDTLQALGPGHLCQGDMILPPQYWTGWSWMEQQLDHMFAFLCIYASAHICSFTLRKVTTDSSKEHAVMERKMGNAERSLLEQVTSTPSSGGGGRTFCLKSTQEHSLVTSPFWVRSLGKQLRLFAPPVFHH